MCSFTLTRPVPEEKKLASVSANVNIVVILSMLKQPHHVNRPNCLNVGKRSKEEGGRLFDYFSPLAKWPFRIDLIRRGQRKR